MVGSLANALTGNVRQGLEQAAYDLSQQPIDEATRLYELSRLGQQYGYDVNGLQAVNHGVNAGQTLSGAATGSYGSTGPQQILNQAAYDLQQQMDSKAISGEQMSAELERLKGELGYSGPVQAQNYGQSGTAMLNQFQSGSPVSQKPENQQNYNTLGQVQDFADVANAQNYQNAQTQAQFNRVNEVNPYGSSEYIQNADGSYTRKTELSQPQQQIMDQRLGNQIGMGNVAGGLINQVGQSFQNPLNFDNAPALYGANDLLGERQRAEDAIYNRYKGDLDREYGDAQRALESNLANRGIPVGSELWNKEMDRLNRSKSEAMENVRTSAIAGGRDELQTLSDLSRTNRNQVIGETTALRGNALGELTGLSGLLTGENTPQFSGMSQINVGNPDVFGGTVSLVGQGIGIDAEKQMQDIQNKFASGQLSAQQAHEMALQVSQQDWTKKYQFPHQVQLAQLAKGGGGGGGSGTGSDQDAFFYQQLGSVPSARTSRTYGGMTAQGGGK